MELIDRYVQEVIRRLPEQSRADVERELRSNIADMLPDEPTREDVLRVLTELGDPKKLAEEYREVKRYLISPRLYDSYLLVLKIVGIILLCVIPIVVAVKALTGQYITTDGFFAFWQMFGDIFAQAASSAVWGFTFVTLFMVILERTGAFEEMEVVLLKGGKTSRWMPGAGRPRWTPEDLENKPLIIEKTIEQRSEPILGLVFGVIFFLALVVFPQAIGLYQSSASGTATTFTVTPLFNSENWYTVVPLVALSFLLGFAVNIFKLVQRRWTRPLTVLYGIQELVALVALFVVLDPANLSHFNPEFFTALAAIFKIESASLIQYVQYGCWVWVALAACGAVVSIVWSIFRETRRSIGTHF